MDSESKEMLREWLVKSLEPVCDADPEVLSKYVLALIQNDPKKEGLRETCVSKLEEFLGDETTPFVSRLFTALETEAYRKPRTSRPDDVHDGESNHHNQGNQSRHHHQDAPRRRTRTGSDNDNDDDDRYSKRRRDDERPYSPRRSGDRGGGDRGYGGGRDGGRDGGRGGRGAAGPGPRGGADWERRRNFPPEWGIPPPGMWGAPPPQYAHGYPHPGRGGGFHHPMGGDPFDPNGFNPENVGMMPPPHLLMGGGRGQYPYGPPYGGGRGRGGRGQFYGGRSAGGGPLRGEDGLPLGGGADGMAPPVSAAKTTLRVSNVDPKYVNMTKLSLHFSKFGNVVNVQMRPQYKCAYVQYATEDEAKKAFHSPIPVCNNRFIEVKWAKFDAKDPQGAPSEEANAATEETASGTTTGDGDDAGNESGEPPKPTTEGEAAQRSGPSEKDMTPEELRAAALEKGRRVLEEKRELLEKQKQLMKQKEELLKRQLTQQKELLERMSQNPASVSAADKRDLLNKITALSEELKALQPRRDSDPNKLSGLKAELSALEAVAAAGGAVQGVAGGRGGRGRGGGRWAATPPGTAAVAGGRGFYRGGFGGRGGRGAGRSYSNTLDNRTTIVQVDNLPEEARDASVLEQHFGNFGSIERVLVDDAAPTRGYIKFADRYAGQAALARGMVFGDARLELSWVEAQDAPAALAPSPRVASDQPSGGSESGNGDASFQNESAEVPTSA